MTVAGAPRYVYSAVKRHACSNACVVHCPLAEGSHQIVTIQVVLVHLTCAGHDDGPLQNKDQMGCPVTCNTNHHVDHEQGLSRCELPSKW